MKNLLQDILSPVNGSANGLRQLYRVHRKHGQTFALLPDGLPCQRNLAYLLPGQSVTARIYRFAVGWLGTLGWKFPRCSVSLELDLGNSLVHMIQKFGGSFHSPVLLPGNPNGIAPRLVLIALTGNMRPAAVIKAAKTEVGRSLIRREYEFLRALPASFGASIPRPLELLDDQLCTAFAMEFAEGASPRWPANFHKIEAVLTPWVDDSRSVNIRGTALWKALERSLTGNRPPWFEQFANTTIYPCIFHGDFAPWNVRVDAIGVWKVIDWERGEFNGLPGWDWLHFLLQPTILVKKRNLSQILAAAQEAIRSPEFLRYLAAVSPDSLPSDFPEHLFRAYLLYNWHVLKPTEGVKMQAALAEWAGGSDF